MVDIMGKHVGSAFKDSTFGPARYTLAMMAGRALDAVADELWGRCSPRADRGRWDRFVFDLADRLTDDGAALQWRARGQLAAGWTLMHGRTVCGPWWQYVRPIRYYVGPAA